MYPAVQVKNRFIDFNSEFHKLSVSIFSCLLDGCHESTRFGITRPTTTLSSAALSFSNKVIPQLDKTLSRTGQTLRACTVAEGFKEINDFSLVVLKKKVEVVMIALESTSKDVKHFGYDFRGHTRGTLVVGIAYGCPYYKGSAIF